MKDKILVFIIGLLVGAIIIATVFLIIEKNDESMYPISGKEMMQMMDKPDERMEHGRFEEKTEQKRPYTEEKDEVIKDAKLEDRKES